jgi:BirA family biotin operon repressor/biotin-[acetyl-CoA-carboxylase] ligase
MNSRTWHLLRLLADGEFHSGEALGKILGISRATVFTALNDLDIQGVELHRIRGRGYRLANAWCSLNAGEIGDCLGELSTRFQIEILQHAASSNTELLRRATLGAHSGSVLAIELQTAGRGRIGRVWHSGLGNALTFSLLWRFDCGLNRLSGLSLAVGVAIMRALKNSGITGAWLKWPNDILAHHGKLGGVLIEAQGDMYGPGSVVIGIGINCHLSVRIEHSINQAAAALDQLCPLMPGRNELLAYILRELAIVLDQFSCSGFSSFRAEWEQFHALKNQTVQLRTPDGLAVDGIARGVSDSGELILETINGLRQFHSGELGS